MAYNKALTKENRGKLRGERDKTTLLILTFKEDKSWDSGNKFQ